MASSFGWRKTIHSIRFRLTLWFVAILAVILALFSLFIYSRQAQILRTEMVDQLTSQASQLEDYYRSLMRTEFEHDHEGTNSIHLPNGNLPLLQEKELMALVSSQGAIVQSQGNLPVSDLQTLLNQWSGSKNRLEPIIFPISNQDKPYLFKISPVGFEDAWQGVLVLGVPEDSAEQLPRLAMTLMLGSGFILMLAFGGGYWLADRAMSPVQRITQTARQISESDLSGRLRLNQDDELGDLADTFDAMLDRLQKAFQRQRQFTADASHELRTPLTIIELESSRALEHHRSPEEYEKALSIIQSENVWMGQLVNELLTLARMDSGQLVMRREKIILSDLVMDVIDRLTPLAHARKVTLLSGELIDVEVSGDRSLLTQMLTNLVENALKYAEGESAQVLVETGASIKSWQEGGYIRVKDNGPGIPEKHLTHIFERFYRIEESRSWSEKDEISTATGTGLGLAIAQSIARTFGGDIDVESEIGQGTTFTVWLPGFNAAGTS
jgi:signal transduction histidine kinase